jgi:hypothetical protein
LIFIFKNEPKFDALERGPLPDDADMVAVRAEYIRQLQTQQANEQPFARAREQSREQTRERVERLRALGGWGEKKAFDLLTRAGFQNVTNTNAELPNHPFGDIFAELSGMRYLIGVKTRNKYQVSGLINPTYNVRKRGVDIRTIAQRRYNAKPAWVAISVIPEKQSFSAYFGDIDQIEEAGERFSIPMKPEKTADYKPLSRAPEEHDLTIQPAWSNGGYPRRRTQGT